MTDKLSIKIQVEGKVDTEDDLSEVLVNLSEILRHFGLDGTCEVQKSAIETLDGWQWDIYHRSSILLPLTPAGDDNE